jgi:hypothetical protein
MRIGPYEVVSALGEGGVGVVSAGRSPSGADVAIIPDGDPFRAAILEATARYLEGKK